MKRTTVITLAVVFGAMVLACGDGPESCGRKDQTRVVHEHGHTVTQHCENGVWVKQ